MTRFVQVVCLLVCLSLAMSAPAFALAKRQAAAAGGPPSRHDWKKMTIVDQGKVKAFLRGDLIMLDNYRRYRLVNILIPPYEDPRAAEALREKFLGDYVTVYAYPQDNGAWATDKQGLPLVHVVTQQGAWLQQFLVRNGLAHAYNSYAGNALLPQLMYAENQAAEAHAGLWQGTANGIKAPDQAGDYVGSYEIVEGRIMSVRYSNSGGGIFFNFGTNVLTCFSAILPDEFLMWYTEGDRRYAVRTSDWTGRNVQLRGWIVEENHKPVMHITNKDQINVLP